MQPQLITFNEMGDVIIKNIAHKNIYSFKKLLRLIKEARRGGDIDYDKILYSGNMTSIVNDIHRFINDMHGLHKTEKKIKILTVCNKDVSFCRFLFCMPEKRICTLCETKLKDLTANATNCDDVSTAHWFNKECCD